MLAGKKEKRMNRFTSRRKFLKAGGGAVAGLTISAIRGPWAFADASGVTQRPFGKLPDGTGVDVFTLTNAAGTEVRIITLGATLVTVKLREDAGLSPSVCLHFDTLEDYAKPGPLFGAVVGRYANRIAGAKFTIA